MTSLLAHLEQTGLATWIREGGTLTGYPLILFLHTLGLSLLVGLNSGIDLRILGFARGIPLKSLERTFPIMWSGLAVNAATGSLLFMADANRHFSNPAFFVKLAFVALALVGLALIRTRVFRDPLLDTVPVQRNARIMAAGSLCCWFGAISAGRLMAYINEFIA